MTASSRTMSMKSNASHALTFNDPVSTSMPNCSAPSIASVATSGAPNHGKNMMMKSAMPDIPAMSSPVRTLLNSISVSSSWLVGGAYRLLAGSGAGRAEGVDEQHRDRHRPDADVYHRRAGLYHLGPDRARRTDRGDEHVGARGGLRQVPSARMADRDRRA